ncbi:hypothetical protein COCON_G00017400 [Conger conger]|uniref:Uncharacterized protein n=1 Tax=Conger conger TaxID=82655 RepID=A0A9Q1I9Q7_CONCO|nr:hypothetical protein COCON_G00017400 [Conger conger]
MSVCTCVCLLNSTVLHWLIHNIQCMCFDCQLMLCVYTANAFRLPKKQLCLFLLIQAIICSICWVFMKSILFVFLLLVYLDLHQI